jgi:hypothetical protein
LTPPSAPSLLRRSGPDAVPLGEAKKNARGGGEDVLASMARRLVRAEHFASFPVVPPRRNPR